MKSSSWSRDQRAAFDEADRVYTRTFAVAMRAFDREDGLRAAMDAYNAIMTPAHQRWKDDYAAAVALADEPF